MAKETNDLEVLEAMHELRQMAQVYLKHNRYDKAQELLDLCDRMELRLVHANNVVDMAAFESHYEIDGNGGQDAERKNRSEAS